MICVFMVLNCCRAEELKETVLSVHNQFRAWHHGEPLMWDDRLASYAERHASQCQFKHSHLGFGENIAAGYPSVTDAINSWYGEVKNYSYLAPGFSYKTGHFTQVVWRETKRIGCANVACNGSKGTPGHFLVCEYSPAGNVLGKQYFIENVVPKI